LLGLFFIPVRFMVAVIFKGPHRALSAPRGVFSNRALAFVSLYLIGEGFVMASDLAHIGHHRLHPHFANWRVRSLINKDRRSHLLRGGSGDFRVVVKIAQTHFHRRPPSRGAASVWERRAWCRLGRMPRSGYLPENFSNVSINSGVALAWYRYSFERRSKVRVRLYLFDLPTALPSLPGTKRRVDERPSLGQSHRTRCGLRGSHLEA
jgi:hypothetical protein